MPKRQQYSLHRRTAILLVKKVWGHDVLYYREDPETFRESLIIKLLWKLWKCKNRENRKISLEYIFNGFARCYFKTPRDRLITNLHFSSSWLGNYLYFFTFNYLSISIIVLVVNSKLELKQ